MRLSIAAAFPTRRMKSELLRTAELEASANTRVPNVTWLAAVTCVLLPGFSAVEAPLATTLGSQLSHGTLVIELEFAHLFVCGRNCEAGKVLADVAAQREGGDAGAVLRQRQLDPC